MTAIHLTVTINSDDLRRWADRHADAGHHGVAHVLYQAANEAAGITAQHDAEVAAKALRDAADEAEYERDIARHAHQSANATHFAHDYCRWVGHAEALTTEVQRLRASADRIEREATSE